MVINQSIQPEFVGKPEEDTKAHVLRTIDWMDTQFCCRSRVKRFPLTLVGEVRLWYQSLHPFQGNWEELQEKFRTQFSKIGNSREQLFHSWRSFHHDKNTETIDAYVQRI